MTDDSRRPPEKRVVNVRRYAIAENNPRLVRVNFMDTSPDDDEPYVEHAYCEPAVCIEVDASDPVQALCPKRTL